jgi:O-acetyl-ADP-ribose deacetylase (regulator of RNase III)
LEIPKRTGQPVLFSFNATIDPEGKFQGISPSPTARTGTMNKLLRSTKLDDQVEIQLIEGDILAVKADGVVNPANSHLIHGGGLAGILTRKAGPVLQRESAAWVKEHGPVSHGSPAFTSAGALPFKAVIHAVGPVWGSGNESEKLRAAVLGSLERAQELALDSLALPAISTGIFGYPLQEAAQVILGAVRDFSQQDQSRGLSQILVVLYDDRAAAAFSEAWDRIFP